MCPRDDKQGPRDPFKMLEKSHRRLQEHLEALREAAAALPDPSAVQTLREVSEFLDRSVTRHEKDEEESLFPRIRGDGDLAPVLAELEAEHRAHEVLHAELRALTEAPTAEAAQDLSRRLDEAYERHVEIEEGRVFPAARAMLDEADLAALAEEMQARRGK